MLPGVSGSLVSEYFAEVVLPEQFPGQLGEGTREAARKAFLRWRREAARRLGPVSGARAVYDVAAAPVVRLLGFEPCLATTAAGGELVLATLGPRDARAPLLLVTPWARLLDSAWRDGVRHSLGLEAAWCLSTNGRHLRLVDARRTYARRFVEFDLDCALDEERSFAVLWALLRCGAGGPLVDRIVQASDLNSVGVCRSLRRGVLDALGELLSGLVFVGSRRAAPVTRADLAEAHEQALTIVYRILFLLFAESRGLAPLWHPIYRESYSLDAVRDLAERPGPATGLWEMLQAISRLAHSGCRAGSLRVTPFNGRLFAPSATPLGERARLDDEAARRVVLALSTAPVRRGGARGRIVYRDLGVEQLGAVYESVLDHRPALEDASASRPDRPLPCVRLKPGGVARRAGGTFYTPGPITSFVVRRTLAPLVADATPEAILDLRVVDPAMGSGAFLVAACRFLAAAYEAAVVRQGGCHDSDISDEDRRGFRRAVAQRCLYGVDRDPIAVQLARLSLWLSTLSPDRPLSFLDHHLVAGDSLVGASLDDLWRPPPGSAPTRRPKPDGDAALPLFEPDTLGPALRVVLPERLRVATTPDDSVAVVREKERIVTGLSGDRSPLSGWKAVADLWCGLGFRADEARVSAALFGELADHLLRGRSALPAGVAATLVADARRVASERRFFHWSLEFPELFHGADGAPLPHPGFHAVIANPPWDMIRADNDAPGERAAARAEVRRMLRFARDSGLYPAQGDGHANLFQLFVERAFRLARDGGRLGLVVPWGLAADRGCRGLRRLLLDHTAIDSFVGFDNASAIFPIHRSVRFLALTATKGGRTEALACRLGQRDPSLLDSLPDRGESAESEPPVVITRGLLERVSPGDLAVPDLRTTRDCELLEKLSSAAPALGSAGGWHARFGRELNATDDRGHFDDGPGGLPVLEGKHVEPFRAVWPGDVRRLPRRAAARVHGGGRTFWHPRLAVRDVAGATNRLTLIAAIVPAGCATVHTLSCLRSRLPARDQAFLCGVLNSFVANYLVRQRVTTHVSLGIVSGLPVPRPDAESPRYALIADLADGLARSPDPERDPSYPRLQAAVGALYGLTGDELEHVLSTFPIVEEEVKRTTQEEFRELVIVGF
jgi:hypothetical protein